MTKFKNLQISLSGALRLSGGSMPTKVAQTFLRPISGVLQAGFETAVER